jgi:adenylate kinase
MWKQNGRKAWFKGSSAACGEAPCNTLRPRRIVLLGAPGTGKGTQAKLLAQRLGACHLSTGDLFHHAAKASACADNTPMAAALAAMRRGELVSDDTILDLIRDRSRCLVCRGGFILDGFPRTVAQAQSLDGLLTNRRISLDAVVNYVLPSEQIVIRLAGRRICSQCKAVFHIGMLTPETAHKCVHCGGQLVQREDDLPEVIRERLRVYDRQTAPLTDFYRARGLLVTIDASGGPETILSRTLSPFSAGLRATPVAG